MTTVTQPGEFEDEFSQTDFHPQGYRVVNTEVQREGPVTNIPPSQIKMSYPDHPRPSKYHNYPGEILFTTEKVNSDLETALDPDRTVEDDRLFVQSTVNGCPIMIERSYTREEMLKKLDAETKMDAIKQFERMLSSNETYNKYLQASITEEELPAWKTDISIPEFRDNTGGDDPTYGVDFDVQFQALRGLCAPLGAYTQVLGANFAHKRQMLRDEETTFSNIFAGGETDGAYYVMSYAKEQLVGFAFFDHMMRTDVPDYNPNSQKPPVAISHGLKLTDNLQFSGREPKTADMVFSVSPEANEDGEYNVHTVDDPNRLVRETLTISFEDFLVQRSRENMEADMGGIKKGETMPYQKFIGANPERRIYGDAAAFYDPERFTAQQRQVVVNGQVRRIELVATAAQPGATLASAAIPDAEWELPERNLLSLDNFIGQSHSAVNSQGKFLVYHNLTF